MQLNFNPFPTLTTERLVLRPLEITDDIELFKLRSDAVVNKYIAIQRPRSVEEIHQFIHQLQNFVRENESILWAISTKEDPKLIGTACYWNISVENKSVEIGYMLMPHMHGKGYMHETIGALIPYGFEIMKAQSIEAFTHKDNTASVKLLERHGFSRNKTLEDKHADKEELKDIVIYSLHQF